MKEFSGKLGRYQIIETEDGSKTLWSEAFNENCHSLSGAILETLHNYIEGTQLSETIQKTSSSIVVEVGFGTGIGADLTYQQLQKLNSAHSLCFISFEIDEGLVCWSRDHASRHSPLHFLEKDDGLPFPVYRAELGNFKLLIPVGDARQTINLLPELMTGRIDAIFQDPFSPKKNPNLWTVEWFKDLASYSNQNVKLSTYSASSQIRKSLILAGWVPKSRAGFKGKKEGTCATLQGEADPKLLEHLSRSPLPPLTDDSVKSS